MFWSVTTLGAAAAPLPVDLRDLPQQPLIFGGQGINEHVGVPFGEPSSRTIETHCDLDGDGVDDLVAGASGWTIGNGNGGHHGRLHVIRGRSGWTGGILPTTAQTIAISGGQDNYRFAEDVVCAGDVDGDGIDDLAVGHGSNAPTAVKFAYLVYGSADLFTAGSFSLDQAGGRVVGFTGVNQRPGSAPTQWVPLGDLDGDGHADLALSSGSSGLWVVPGRPRDEIAGNSIDVSEPEGGYLAATGITYSYDTLEPAGDVDGDGVDDLAIGQYTLNGTGGSESGVVQIVSTAALADPEAAPFNVATEPAGAKVLFRIHGPAVYAHAGTAIAALGDVDGDGRDDIAVGVPGSRYATPVGETPQIGQVFVLWGRTSHDAVSLPDLGADGGYAISGLPGSAEFGSVVEAAGDLNGDGIGDLLIGAYDYTNPALPAGVNRSGGVFVVYGKTDATTVDATDPTPETGAALLGSYFYQQLGAGLATTADLDGNGLPELIAGSNPNGKPGTGQLIVLRLGEPLPDPPGPGPGPGPDVTTPTPDDKAKPTPKPKPFSATGDVTKTGRKGATTVALSKRPGAKASKAYRVKLVRKGKTIATGTVKGKTLKLQIRKVAKGKKARYPKLKGTYTLTGAKGVTGVTKTQLKIS